MDKLNEKLREKHNEETTKKGGTRLKCWEKVWRQDDVKETQRSQGNFVS